MNLSSLVNPSNTVATQDAQVPVATTRSEAVLVPSTATMPSASTSAITQTTNNTIANVTNGCSLNLNEVVKAYTKEVKADGIVKRPAIPVFTFGLEQSYDLMDSKMQSVLKVLVIQAIKDDIQAIDRDSLFSPETIAQEFGNLACQYDLDKLYSIVCTNTSGRFGLKSFNSWIKDSLIPAMEVIKGKLSTQTVKTILSATKDGYRMPEPAKVKVIEWIELYALEIVDVDKVLTYLTEDKPEIAINDLSALDI